MGRSGRLRDEAGARRRHAALHDARSPCGTVTAQVLNADSSERMAVLFQPRHGWDCGKGSRGNDMGIDAKEVVVLVPS